MLKRFMTLASSTCAGTPIREWSFHGVRLGYGRLLAPQIPFDPTKNNSFWKRHLDSFVSNQTCLCILQNWSSNGNPARAVTRHSMD